MSFMNTSSNSLQKWAVKVTMIHTIIPLKGGRTKKLMQNTKKAPQNTQFT